MKSLILVTIINSIAMLLLIVSRLLSKNEGFDWILTFAIVLIVINWIHYFIQYKKTK